VFLAIAGDSVALGQVWVFIVAPLIGAAIAAFCWKALKPADDSE
jgi:aquaporin Z